MERKGEIKTRPCIFSKSMNLRIEMTSKISLENSDRRGEQHDSIHASLCSSIRSLFRFCYFLFFYSVCSDISFNLYRYVCRVLYESDVCRSDMKKDHGAPLQQNNGGSMYSASASIGGNQLHYKFSTIERILCSKKKKKETETVVNLSYFIHVIIDLLT